MCVGTVFAFIEIAGCIYWIKFNGLSLDLTVIMG